MSPSPPPLSKADRLAIGGAVAPAVRRQAGAPRVVTVVGKDGQPVRQTTAVEVAKSVLARADVEFSVQEGKRPEWVKCKTCGAPVKAGKKGKIRAVCRGGTYNCACGQPIDPNGFTGKCGLGKTCGVCEWACERQRERLRAIPREKDVRLFCACGAPKLRTSRRCRSCWKASFCAEAA